MDDDQALLLQVSADVSKLEKQMARAVGIVHSSATAMENRAELFGGNFGRSLDKVMDSSRLAVIEAGASKLGVFGSALGAIGPVGIAVGASLAAVGAGLAVATKAGEWAEELEKASLKLGISAEALQRFDIIATKSGIGVDAFREALATLNEKLGQAQAGILKPQAMKAFQALGFSPDQLRSFSTVSDFLTAIEAKFSSLGSAAEKAGLAKRLGIEALIPLLNLSKGELDKLNASLGDHTIMSNRAVAASAGFSKEIADAKMRISEAGRTIGADLLPELAKLIEALASAANWWARLFEEMRTGPSAAARAADSMNAGNAATSSAQAARRGDRSQLIWGNNGGNSPSPLAALTATQADLNAYARRKEAEAAGDYAAAAKILADERAAEKADEVKPPPAAKVLVQPKPKKPKAGPHDNTASMTGTVDATLDEAAKGYLEAMAALITEVQAHAAYEKQVVAEELQKKSDAIDAEEAKIKADKGISAAKKVQLTRALEAARADDQLAAVAKDELIDRKAADALAKQRLDLQDAQVTAQIDELKASLAITVGSGARQDLQLKIFAAEEEIQRAKLEEVIASQSSTDAQKKIAQLQLDTLSITADARRKAVADGSLSPGQTYVKSITDKFGEGMSDTWQKIEVNGLTTLNQGLTAAIVNANGLGAAFGNMARAIEADLLNLLIEKYLTLPIAQALGLASGAGGVGAAASGEWNWGTLISAASFFGFAGGTDSAPGGLSIVGENGPELLNVPKGAQIIPNNVLGSIGSITPGISTRTTIMSFDLRGAVMTADLLDQMNSMAKSAEQRATVNGATMGASVARQMIPAEMARRQSLQIR